MKMDSFRELLLKKADGDPTLQSFIKYVREDLIADHALDILEKMARASHKGDTANLAMRDFATEMDPELHPHLIRDALGHHASQYKASLKTGNKALANRHAEQMFKIMNMADRVQKHTGGKLSFEHVSTHPWERNKFKNTYAEDHPKVQEGKYKAGDFTTKTKGLNYKGSDYSFLHEAPFTGKDAYKKEVERHGHSKAYPFEQMRVNGKHIHVDDDADVSQGYKEHPFDKHPIMSHYADAAHDRTPEKEQQYLAEKEKFYNEQPHLDEFFKRHAELEAKDPQAYAQRGMKPSNPVHEVLEQNKPAQPAAEAAPAQEAAPAAPGVNLDALPEELRNQILAWQKAQGNK